VEAAGTVVVVGVGVVTGGVVVVGAVVVADVLVLVTVGAGGVIRWAASFASTCGRGRTNVTSPG
jgi:hypothetical protein